MSDTDHSPTHETGHSRAPGHDVHDAKIHQLKLAERELARIEALQHPTFEQALDQSRQMLKECYLEARALDMASRAQRDHLLSGLSELPMPARDSAQAQALALARSQDKALDEVQSNLRLRVLEARLGMEAHIYNGTPLEALSRSVKSIADSVEGRSHDAVAEINWQMRESLADWQARSGRPLPAKFTSANAHFAVSPEGRVTIYASKGGKGDIHALLPDGSSVTASFTSTQHQQVSWTWQSVGQIRQDTTHPTEGVHQPRFNLNLETTPAKERADNRTGRSQSNSGARLEGDVGLPIKALEFEAKGAYQAAGEHVEERNQAEKVTMPTGSSKTALSFEVQFLEPSAQNIEILRGTSHHKRE